eukprot:TRINITY_DN676_c2_g2_i3.p1 TRINITY_DN676_c2_g2~~TRINITY_DN676_c2_g2_i3.p1  ORF type:complete len:724 (+),score=272.95 TRINITY_DN676_c2_g2_i3:88-2259(+)
MEPATQFGAEGVQDVLNRMVPDPAQYDMLVEELVGLVLKEVEAGNADAMTELADKLHRKAVVSTDMSMVYADSARDIVRLVKKRGGAFKEFSSSLIERCTAMFEELKVLSLDDESEYLEDKTQKLGNMQFIGELYARGIIPAEPMQLMLDELTGAECDLPPSTDNVEALRVFLLLSTPGSGDEIIDGALGAAKALYEAQQSSSRMKRLLTDVLEAHSVLPKAEEPPKPQPQPPQPQHYPAPHPAPPAGLEHSTSSFQDSPTTPTDYNGYVSSQNASFDLGRSVSCDNNTPLSGSMGYYPQQGPATPLQPPPPQTHQGREPRNRKKDVKLYQLQQAARRERTVYVVGIDASLSEGELLSFIAQCGSLVKVRLCGDTTNRTIYGFFEFETKECAQNLVSKTGSTLGNYIIHCSFARQAIRDLSHGQADSKIRTLNFDQKPQLDNMCRDSILNDPQWLSSKQRGYGYRKGSGMDMHRQGSGATSGPNTPIQPGMQPPGHPPPQSPLTPGSYHTGPGAWDPSRGIGGDDMSSPGGTPMHMPPHGMPGADPRMMHPMHGGGPPQTSTQASSLPHAVRHMAQTHTPPAGLPCHLGDMGAVAVSNTAIGAGEWGDITGYIPAFLRAVEKIFRVEALQVLKDGADHFLAVLDMQPIPTQNVCIAWSRLAYIIALCFKAEIVCVEGTAQLVQKLRYNYHGNNTWLQFSTDLTTNLISSGYDYDVVGQIMPQL